MEKCIFVEYHDSDYEVDPVFKTKEFRLFGNPRAFDSPVLFYVSFEGKGYQYCLTKPDECVKKEDLLLKIRRYILAQSDDKNVHPNSGIFFVGDVGFAAEVSKDFANQRIILVDYSMIEEWYPKRLDDILKIVLRHILVNQKYLGQLHNFSLISDDFLFVDPNMESGEITMYRKYILDCLINDGYVSLLNNAMLKDCFVLTTKGISLVEEKKTNQSKVGFIAIKFNDNQERINAIYKAIEKAGFEPRVMNRYETNNWIMPEVFFQIENSRFVVADFSLPCDGAYYEAGYAAALKKPVIHLFDKREERGDNTLHFDISQKSTIFYDDYEDLEKRLVDRIIATIR